MCSGRVGRERVVARGAVRVVRREGFGRGKGSCMFFFLSVSGEGTSLG